MPDVRLDRRCALIVAHPGHELRVHGWLERARPTVYVLTDGSGRGSVGRLGATIDVLQRAGARRGCIFGRCSDRDLYAHLLAGNVCHFVALAAELCDALQRGDTALIVGDAAEGYNPAHDVCRLLIDAVAGRLRATRGQAVTNLDFLLAGPPDECPPAAERHQLDDAAWRRKVAAARSYGPLAAEVESAFARFGVKPFATEVLRPAGRSAAALRDPPEYERFGEERRRAGHYSEVIRAREHVTPVAAALRAWAEGTDA